MEAQTPRCPEFTSHARVYYCMVFCQPQEQSPVSAKSAKVGPKCIGVIFGCQELEKKERKDSDHVRVGGRNSSEKRRENKTGQEA